ncbi:thioredoxin family protein [bacterium]|nr:thioredoxin family protein [bacterium]
MKKLLLLLLTAVSLSYSTELIPGFVDGDVASVMKAAKTKNQIIMIDFFTTWCGPCKLLDQNIYRSAAFKAYTEQMICYKIDAEKGEGIAMADKYGVRVYPSVVFIDADGNEVERKVGYEPDINRYLKELDRIILGKDVYAQWMKEYQKKPSYESAAKLAEYYLRYDLIKAVPYYQFALNSDPQISKGMTRDLLMQHAVTALQFSIDSIGIPEAENFLKRFPEHPASHSVAANLAYAYLRKNMNDKAWNLITMTYEKADDAGRKGIEDIYQRIRQATGHTTKEEDYAELEKLDGTAARGASRMIEIYTKHGEKDKAASVVLNWIQKNPNGSLSDYNDVGWSAFEAKAAEKEMATSLIKKWDSSPAANQDSYVADTIASLCEALGDKANAVRFGEYAVKMSRDGSKMKKTFEENLKRYQNMK